MTSDPRDILAMRAATAPAPGMQRGSSSFFTTPTQGLDPNLFEGDQMLPGVREWIARTGYDFLNTRYKGAHTWATIWVAGSGVTYQWSAARSPGDLDVLVGVKTQSFKQHNPEFKGTSDTEIAHHVTDTFRVLGKQTEQQHIGEGVYEVTWYVNPGAADIRDIHPYAAYDVTHNRWTVRPPDLPGDWGTGYFPHDWWQIIGREKKHAHEIIGEFLGARQHYLMSTDDAQRRNAATSLDYAAVQAQVFFDDIHDNRRLAFSPQGNGYSDWHNFRWQAHKRNGVIPALHAIAALRKTALEESEEGTYGHRLATSEQALSTASMLHAHLGALEMR